MKTARSVHSLLVARLVRQCDLPEEALKPFAVGHLLNMLFLYRGEFSDVGSYPATMQAVYDLIGFDCLWKPLEEDQAEEREAKVN